MPKTSILGSIRTGNWRSGVALVAAALAALTWTCAIAAPPVFALTDAGCPMAHCNSRLSNAVGSKSPTVAQEVRVDRSSAGAVGGLGCVSNTQLVACTGASNPMVKPNLDVYDADGNKVWDDGGILGSTAWYSAAMISKAGEVIAADQRWLLRADPVSGSILWQSEKPDDGTPISPVLVGNDASMILLATHANAGGGMPEVSIWDVATGELLSHQPIVDPASAVLYGTLNTPAVSGNRAYILASGVETPNDGRLYAIEVCESSACGGRGSIKIVWHFEFDGPSSASPLLIGNRIFFDGLRGQATGLYFGVDDLGDSPSLAWTRKYRGRFGFNAAQDPRGGLWISPWQSGTLLRVSEGNGKTLQSIDISSALGLAAGYSPVTAVSMTRNAAGAIVLTTGVQASNSQPGLGPHVGAIDVSTTSNGTGIWKYRVSPSNARNAATGQYPVVVNAAGARRIVFRGTVSSTFFIGEP